MRLRTFCCFAARPLLPSLACVVLSLGCDRDKAGQNAPSDQSDSAPAPSASAPSANDAPAEGDKPSAKELAKQMQDLHPMEEVQKVVNPKGLSPYSGPTGSVRGIVKVTGDEAPELPEVLAKMEAKCDLSQSMFGKVFREGEGRTLGDVLVAVTEYEGYVPSGEVDVPVFAKGCAWQSRTIAMTYGQRLTIDGVDNRPYVPEILGQPMPAQLFVLPTAPPVKLPPRKPGRKKLVDSMRLYNVAELFVLPYATFDVTGRDGKFQIDGIPTGKVKINALLPQTGAVEGKEITIEAGKTTEVEFTLSFSREAYDRMEKPTPLDELPAPGQ